MIKIAILMGGSSREREISFAGGRTVYDNLDKSIFEAIPIFIDSLQNWILLDWEYVYKGTIRDFYPSAAFLPESPNGFQIYAESLDKHTDFESLIDSIGTRISPFELIKLADFAFLTLHGEGGEDGKIQGLLEYVGIPYSGSGIRASCMGMDKAFQKKMGFYGEFATPNFFKLQRAQWLADADYYLQHIEAQFESVYPIVVRPANQGSSIGVAIVNNAAELKSAIQKAFFIEYIQAEVWKAYSLEQKVAYLRTLTDIRTGLGFPLWVNTFDYSPENAILHPEALLGWLDAFFQNPDNLQADLYAYHSEQTVVVEGFIRGKEFSCVVITGLDDQPLALPPTEIVKGGEVFDYRSKYLAGLARKITPINLPDAQIEAIRAECERLYTYFGFDVYARIDGFIDEEGKIFLNDPNTTSGMLPSSFFFHQAAEIGLNPSQFLTYIIHASVRARVQTTPILGRYDGLLSKLATALQNAKDAPRAKQKIGVFLGGYSSERHISVESGRNIYEKLSSSAQYQPIPIFVSADAECKYRLFQIPISLLLKDNADDIREKILHYELHPVVAEIRERAQPITELFAGGTVLFEPQEVGYETLKNRVDAVFIGLHGRPGEDGEIQTGLEKVGIPYNGSCPASAALTIDKYRTLQTLKMAGFAVAEQFLLSKNAYAEDPKQAVAQIVQKFGYPLIAKPVDDGCSSAVKLIRNEQQLADYLRVMFRENEELNSEQIQALGLRPKEEFPLKNQVLIEEFIQKKDAIHFLEVTGGLLTHKLPNGEVKYELFEPSETLASGAILSLEEKFLAGEGQNLTPARFVPAQTQLSHAAISAQVRRDLEKAARLLGVEGYARIDAFVRVYADGRAETLVIEVNSLPGMTPATCIFHQCALNGYKPFEFIDKILEYGRARQAS